MVVNIYNFDSVFSGIPKTCYPTNTGEEVVRAQELLGGQIFFQILLYSLQIKATHLYPPRNATDLEELHRHIVEDKSVDEVQKLSLLYYLLKDCDLVQQNSQSTIGSQSGSKVSRGRRRREEEDEVQWARSFAETIYLPLGHQMGVESYWLLDKLQVKEAFPFLVHPITHPIVKTRFNEVVLFTLINSNLDSLALVYFEWPGARLNLNNGPTGLKAALFQLKASTSLTEALFFWREENLNVKDEKKEMLKVLVDVALDDDDHEELIDELVRFPFNDEEENILIEILGEEEQSARKKLRKHGATETLVLRDMAKYRFKSAAKRIRGMDHTTVEERVKWECILIQMKHT